MSLPGQPVAKQRARFFLLVAVTLVALEASVYLVLAILGLTNTTDVGIATGVGIGSFLALYGLAQLYACWKLLAWRPWARGPLLFTQLIQLGLAWGLRDSDLPWLAIVMAASAAIALGCLVAPAVTRALLDEDAV